MTLTKRQREIAELAAQDLSYREIAARLEPTPSGKQCDIRTIEAHVAAIARRIRDSGFPSPRGGLWLIRRWMRSRQQSTA